jgi:hypothetical protein
VCLANYHEVAQKGFKSRGIKPTSDRQSEYPSSVWTTTTFNLDPHTCTQPHRDAGNIPFGLCAVVALGDFDFTAGGHLGFEEIKALVEVRPGDLVLFPSALLTHWNTPVATHENRHSIVFWSCGQTFRYFAMDGQLLKDLTPQERREEEAKARRAWHEGLQKYLTIDGLKAHYTERGA